MHELVHIPTPNYVIALIDLLGNVVYLQEATWILAVYDPCFDRVQLLALSITRYYRCMQMLQLPLVLLSRTRFFKDRDTLGNVMFWIGEY